MAASPLKLIRAGMVLDGAGRRHTPGAILLDGRRVVAAGTPQTIGQAPAAEETRPDHVLIPALVNVHAHLDLTHVGPERYTGDFVSWVNLVRSRRAVSPEDIAESVQLGAALAVAGGTAVIGDIAGVASVHAVEALRRSPLCGVSYVELFGQGARQSAAIEFMHGLFETIAPDERGVRVGLQPHAPYSCGKSVYEAAAQFDLDVPLATHLAETPEELAFVKSAPGTALARMLEAIGVWDESIAGYGCHPLDALADVLSRRPFVAAHLNYVEDRHIESIAQWPLTVAYCPRASAYFGRVHRYRDMLDAGVKVALGTDSIICLDTPDRISVLDDTRLLYRRDGTDPTTLLRMATITGAEALGFDSSLLTFDEGPIAGVLAMPFDPNDRTDPFVQVLRRDDAPQWIVGP